MAVWGQRVGRPGCHKLGRHRRFAAIVALVVLQNGSDSGSDGTEALDTTVAPAVADPTTTVPPLNTTAPDAVVPTSVVPTFTLPPFTVPTFLIADLTWTTDTEAIGAVDWVEATAYCGQLEGSFRLPTIAELETITDPTDPDPFGQKILRIFHDGVRSNWIWSSDKDGAAAAFAYDFGELSKVSLALNFDQGAHALCVSP